MKPAAPEKRGRTGKPAPYLVRAEGLDQNGAGTATLGGALVHVAGLLPGEEAEVVTEHRSPHTAEIWAAVRRRRNAAQERVVPVCPGYGRCGGCVLQHLAYPAQLAWKQRRLEEALAQAGVTPQEPVPPAVASPADPATGLHYRSRVKLVAAAGPGGRVILGAYRQRSHEITDMSGCQVVAKVLDRVAGTVAQAATALSLAVYDERTGRGALRYVLLREAGSGEVQVSLVVAETPAQELLDGLVGRLREAHPQVVSVVLHHNRQRGNVLLAPELPDQEPGLEDRVLFGPAALWERIGEVQLRVSPRSFLQINREVAARIYDDVAAGLAAAAPGSPLPPAPEHGLLDLYAGVGGLGLALVNQVPGVRRAGCAGLWGIEENPAAVADAQASARRAGLGEEEARFICDDVEVALRRLVAARERFSLAVVNPPRRGCSGEVLSLLTALGPRALAYVSCDPDTLARDLAGLAGAGYRLLSATPYDMHPHTPHVEAVALLVAGPSSR